MGKKVLAVYFYTDEKSSSGFGNMMLKREKPNRPLTLEEVREIENEIQDGLLQMGKTVQTVVLTNVIPLGGSK